ncbi:MAG: hypothetical protein HKN82_02100 [Akkermansiaceae bacterium]|nr:hypothetical protein [Akkermansiaceae bacterium]
MLGGEMKTNRRQFLQAGTAAGTFGFLAKVPLVTAAETRLDPGFVQFRPEIEPLVRLLEDTPRGQLLEEVAGKIKTGTSYREILGALLLAGVRNIQPRPVGFKFHAVLVVNSAHLASRNSPDTDRWLPIFWALDYFKSSQARDVKEGNWTMAPVEERLVPGAVEAPAMFAAAMDRWDEAKADAAVAGLARTAGAQELFEIFARYGARDFRDIGHKAIYVANSWRTLHNIGWRHAEPVLRSLAYALLEHHGRNPADHEFEADLPGRMNAGLLKEIRKGWQDGEAKPEATTELLATCRAGTWEDASRKVVELLNKGVAPQSLWDAVFEHAAELLMRKPGIVSLHACTTTNALHYAYRQCYNDETRRYLLLQNAAFLTMFRTSGGVTDGVAIDRFAPADGRPEVDEIFAAVSKNRMRAARQALAFLERADDPKPFIDAAQRLIYLKGTDSHDYKFSSAVLEDYHHLSPRLRNRFLAASTFWLEGSGKPDSPLVARTRAALA